MAQVKHTGRVYYCPSCGQHWWTSARGLKAVCTRCELPVCECPNPEQCSQADTHGIKEWVILRNKK